MEGSWIDPYQTWRPKSLHGTSFNQWFDEVEPYRWKKCINLTGTMLKTNDNKFVGLLSEVEKRDQPCISKTTPRTEFECFFNTLLLLYLKYNYSNFYSLLQTHAIFSLNFIDKRSIIEK